MTKKLISVIFALVFAISTVSVLSVTASATETKSAVYPYSTSDALSYAAKNWNNGKGMCADFASKCIQAGGINVYKPRCVDLFNALNGIHGTAYKLKLTGGTNGSIRMADNEGKVGKGDLIFYFCNICKTYTHVVVCNGANSAGYVQDYAHNKAHNGRKQTYTYGHCGTSNWTMYSIVLDKGPLRYGTKTTVATPAISSLSNGANGVAVKWNGVDGADKYNVYRKTDSTSWRRVAQTTKTNCTDKTATTGVKYYYTVRAVDNNVLSQYYNNNSIVALGAPRVSATNSIDSVTVKWTKVQNAEGYYVYRANEANRWVRVATVKGNEVLSYTDKNVESSKNYKYTVKAYAGGLSGAYSSKGATVLYLDAPTCFKAENVSNGIKISFGVVAGAEKYRIYRKAVGETKWTSLGFASTNEFVDSTSKEGVSYIYTARAMNGNTYSNYYRAPLTFKVNGSSGSQNGEIIDMVVQGAVSSANSK